MQTFRDRDRDGQHGDDTSKLHQHAEFIYRLSKGNETPN